MSPLEAAARFSAFAWYTQAAAPGLAAPEEARLFARENWEAFLPAAEEGLGRLLLRIARMPSGKRRRTPKRCAAAAG
jgi:hypothetical protein